MLQIREPMRLPIGALLLGVALSGAALTGSAIAADRMHTVIIANTGQVNTLDPIRADYAQTYDLVSRIYSVLVTYDAKTNVVGDLASDYKIAPDAKSIDFTLRDATFHDGSKVTAKDVAFSLDRTKKLGIGAASFIELYDSTEVKDDTHFTIKLTAPSSLFLGNLTKVMILNAELVTEHAGSDDGQAWLTNNDAGGGPYRLASFSGNDVVLDWFDKYFTPIGNRPQSLDVRRIDESSTRRDEITAGNVDVGLSLSQRDLYALANQPGLAISEGPKTTIDGIYFNAQSGPTADAKVREAIRLSYDYEGALKGIHQGHGELPNGPLPSALACRPDLPKPARDVDKAKALLKEAGQSNLTLTLSYQPVFQEQVQMATLLQSNLKDVGVTLNLEPIAFPNYLERLKTPAQIPQMMLIAEYSQFPDPGSFLSKTYMSGAVGTNRSGYSNPKVDELLKQALVNPDAGQRCDAYKEVQTIINDDSVFMDMYMPESALIYRSSLLEDPQANVVDAHYAPLTYPLKAK
jgi:peptide/nickel transport system substrate-binding protein